MQAESPNSSVMDLVSYFEQRQNTSSRRGQFAQPQAVRPGSAGKLLALSADTLENMTMSQQLTNETRLTYPQNPQHPHEHARFEQAQPSQSIRRRGAPTHLKIDSSDPFGPLSMNSPYAPAAGLLHSPFGNMLASAPMSANRAEFGLDAMQSPAAQPRRRGHARQDSQMSVASFQSLGNNNYFLPSSSLDFEDSIDLIESSSMMTPPASPKKRKSPTKSPVKSKDRPNHLEMAIVKETGVSSEQVDQLIGDPLPSDPKNWRCLWLKCGHFAARKENIRAHVQTHLGDRPYQCPNCHADFVRPHDFTRHYSTHVDRRDFKCPDCTQAFNRADALQRHRDRDFCNGAIPSSPTKAKRAFDAMEKKRDIPGRKQKKQAARKRTAHKRNDSDMSDGWLSTPAQTPDYISSDPSSPDMILDHMDSMPSTTPSLRQLQPALTNQPMQPEINVPQSFAAQNEDFIEQLLQYNLVQLPAKADNQNQFSLSPPASPEEAHSALPLKQFSPSQKQSRHKQNPTPPASRESMLEFLSASSEKGGSSATVASAPSLPDLSSASPSPIAYPTINDFDDFVNDWADGSDFFDWQGSSMDAGSATSGVQTQEYRIADFGSSDWMRKPSALDRSDTISPADLFADM